MASVALVLMFKTEWILPGHQLPSEVSLHLIQWHSPHSVSFCFLTNSEVFIKPSIVLHWFFCVFFSPFSLVYFSALVLSLSQQMTSDRINLYRSVNTSLWWVFCMIHIHGSLTKGRLVKLHQILHKNLHSFLFPCQAAWLRAQCAISLDHSTSGGHAVGGLGLGPSIDLPRCGLHRRWVLTMWQNWENLNCSITWDIKMRCLFMQIPWWQWR